MSFRMDIPPSVGGPVTDPDLMFEWNGVDTSQFDGTDAWATGDTGMSISVETVTKNYYSNVDTVLRFTMTGSSPAPQSCGRLITGDMPFVGDDRSFSARIRYFGYSDTATQPLAITFLGENAVAGYTGYCTSICGDTDAQWRVEEGVPAAYDNAGYSIAMPRTSTPLPNAASLLAVRADKRSGDIPRFELKALQNYQASQVLGSTNMDKFGGYTTPSVLNPLSLKRMGFAFLNYSGTPSGYIDVEEIRIYRGYRQGDLA